MHLYSGCMALILLCPETRYVDQELLLGVVYGEWEQGQARTRAMLLQFFAGE